MAPNYFGYELTDAKIQTASASKSYTVVASTDVFTSTTHGMADGTQVVLTITTGTAGATASTRYYVRDSATSTFKIAATSGGSAVDITSDGTGTLLALVETDLLYANKVEIDTDKTTLTFEGDAASRQIFFTSGMSARIAPDCLNIAALETIFSKTPVTSNLPVGLTRLTWFGELAETAGVSAGLWTEGYAVKNSSGVESVVTIRVWVPLGVITLSGPPTSQTKQKMGQQEYQLAASRAAVDIIGAALPGIPTGGAFYALAER